MKLEVQQILANRDKSQVFSVSYSENQVLYQGITFTITEKKPFDLRLTNADDKKLVISGSTVLHGFIPCDRCLEDVSVDIPVEISRELNLLDGQVLTDPEEEEDTFYEEHQIDSDRLIFDEILVNWPAKVLCQEDCKGICHVCGKNLNLGDCGCDRAVLDPRMAAFQDVFNEFKEV